MSATHIEVGERPNTTLIRKDSILWAKAFSVAGIPNITLHLVTQGESTMRMEVAYATADKRDEDYGYLIERLCQS